ncbi:hypothetical protein BVX98_05165 [bacterium F11]|nr:hypothetical protein BVX98_05165 [bacterium F11]
MDSTFSHYEFAALITVGITFALGLFSIVSDWKKPIVRPFGIYLLLIAAWAFFLYLMISAKDEKTSLFFARFLHCPSSFLPATYLSFILHLISTSQNKTHFWLRRISYSIGFLFLLITFHPNFVDRVVPKMGFRFILEPGPLYMFFILWFVFISIVVLVFLLQGLMKSSGIKRNQIAHVILAHIIGYGGGSMIFLPNFNIPVPTFALYCIPVAHLFIFYAIVNHQLLNLKIVLRRAGLLVMIYGMLLLVALPMIYYLYNQAGQHPGLNLKLFFSFLIVLSGIFSIGPFLYAYFVKKSSFYQEHTLAGITHELKSPLATIESITELLEGNLRSGEGPEKSLEYIEIMHRNTDRLKAYVMDLLSLFQVKDKKVLLDMEESDLLEICHQALSEASELATRKKLEIRLSSNTEKMIVNCDRRKIIQVITNLLSNAIKFSPSQRSINIGLKNEKNKFRVTIKDQGQGIPLKDLPFVFDRFFQGRSAKSNQGTGIGLAIAKLWVEAHGGEIGVESE